MNKKGILTKIAELFTTNDESTSTNEEVVLEFVDVKTSDNRILRVSDLALGGTVKEITPDGEVDLEDGDYTLETGETITVLAGVIEEIATAAEETQDEAAPADQAMASMDLMLKDGSSLQVEGEVIAGTKVSKDGADVPAGEYILEDDSILVIGEASDIVEVKPAVAMEEEMEEEVSSDEAEAMGVIKNLKNLINEVKSLKTQFEELKSENESLKSEVEKFSKAPSAPETITGLKFHTESTSIKSPLHSALNIK